MKFIKCFKNSILLSGPNKTSKRPSYLFSLVKTYLSRMEDMEPAGGIIARSCSDIFSEPFSLSFSLSESSLKLFSVGISFNSIRIVSGNGETFFELIFWKLKFCHLKKWNKQGGWAYFLLHQKCEEGEQISNGETFFELIFWKLKFCH